MAVRRAITGNFRRGATTCCARHRCHSCIDVPCSHLTVSCARCRLNNEGRRGVSRSMKRLWCTNQGVGDGDPKASSALLLKASQPIGDGAVETSDKAQLVCFFRVAPAACTGWRIASPTPAATRRMPPSRASQAPAAPPAPLPEPGLCSGGTSGPRRPSVLPRSAASPSPQRLATAAAPPRAETTKCEMQKPSAPASKAWSAKV